MRLLILGADSMAAEHAQHFAEIDGVTLSGVVEPNLGLLTEFCSTHQIQFGFATLEAALARNEFDAIANVTPDAMHHATSLKAIAAGKHVFCEKPLAVNHADALEMTEAAERAGVVAMVNLTYRSVAALQRARQLVLEGAIGAVRHVEAAYLQSWLVSKAWGDWRTDSQWLWRLSKAHGSNGVLGDIGIHILDFAVYGAATDVARVFCRLKTFPKAEGDRIGEYELDANDSFAMTVDFANGALGSIHASRWASGHLNDLTLRIYGDKGGLEVSHSPTASALRTCLGADVENAVWSTEIAPPVPTTYQCFVDAVRAGKNAEPSFRHATNLQKVLDAAVVTDQLRAEGAA